MSLGSISDVVADGPASEEARSVIRFLASVKMTILGASAPGRRLHRGSSANAARLCGSPDSSDLNAGHSATTSSGPRQLRRRELKRDSNSAPSITMRPSLTCVQAEQDMDKLEDFAEDYERERTNQLGVGMDSKCSGTCSQSGSESMSVSLPCRAACSPWSLMLLVFFVSEWVVELHSRMGFFRRATAVHLRDKMGKLSATMSSHGDTNALRLVR